MRLFRFSRTATGRRCGRAPWASFLGPLCITTLHLQSPGHRHAGLLRLDRGLKPLAELAFPSGLAGSTLGLPGARTDGPGTQDGSAVGNGGPTVRSGSHYVPAPTATAPDSLPLNTIWPVNVTTVTEIRAEAPCC